jgi:hypothetical protein
LPFSPLIPPKSVPDGHLGWRLIITVPKRARIGVPVDIAMKASGHSSVQMHKRYVDLGAADVANAFGISQIGKRIGKQKRGPTAK